MRFITKKGVIISWLAFQVGGMVVSAFARLIVELILWSPSDFLNYDTGVIIGYILVGDIRLTLGITFGAICGYTLAYLSGNETKPKSKPKGKSKNKEVS